MTALELAFRKAGVIVPRRPYSATDATIITVLGNGAALLGKRLKARGPAAHTLASMLRCDEESAESEKSEATK
jgi:hypothetical protein